MKKRAAACHLQRGTGALLNLHQSCVATTGRLTLLSHAAHLQVANRLEQPRHCAIAARRQDAQVPADRHGTHARQHGFIAAIMRRDGCDQAILPGALQGLHMHQVFRKS